MDDLLTNWREVLAANSSSQDVAQAARCAILERYAGAIFGYLCDSLRDQHLAADLAQEFALKILCGDFKNANPQRGSFRGLIKQSLRNLIIDCYRKNRLKFEALSQHDLAVDSTSATKELDERFVRHWRREILARTWAELQASDEQSPVPYGLVLRCRAESPAMSSSELAELISAKLRRVVTADWTRQTLRRARIIFEETMRAEIARTLTDGDLTQVDDELSDLDLARYCRQRSRPR